jgi:hypothetical protein
VSKELNDGALQDGRYEFVVAQWVPVAYADALHHLVGALDLSAFDAHYRNDDNGAPTMLFKAVLLAYR